MKLFIIIFFSFFIVYGFTSDGHRYAIDEDIAHQQAIRLATLEPHSEYVEGESGLFFEYPFYKRESVSPCSIGILCHGAYIGHALTQAPFIIINQNLDIISTDTAKFTVDDFNDLHYVHWRNTLDPDITFLEIFYAPFFSSLSVGVFFLLSRSFNYSKSTSLTLTLAFAIGTAIWAYSQTSYNLVPALFFVLVGYLYFRKYEHTDRLIHLIIVGISFGFAYLVRPDTAIVFAIIFSFVIYNILVQKKQKIKQFFVHVPFYVSPFVLSYIISMFIDTIRGKAGGIPGSGILASSSQTPIHVSIFGLLLSPGLGLFVFNPILLTTFFAYVDFFKYHKKETILFLSIIVLFLLYYANIQYWHGLVGWSARYLIMMVPFLLLPLGQSLEIRNNTLLKIMVIILILVGAFFNVVYLIQDVGWFVWGLMGEERGLYALGSVNPEIPLRIHPLTIWTFEYSQLTHAILHVFTNLQPDIYLLKVFGPQMYVILFLIIMTSLTTLLIKYTTTKKFPSIHFK